MVGQIQLLFMDFCGFACQVIRLGQGASFVKVAVHKKIVETGVKSVYASLVALALLEDLADR